MSELHALCDALRYAIKPVPELAYELQVRAARLKSLAEEIQTAAREVPDWMDYAMVIGGLYDAANELEATAFALSVAAGKGRSYIQRTVGAVSEAPSGLNSPRAEDISNHTESLPDSNQAQESTGSKSSARPRPVYASAQQVAPTNAPSRQPTADETRPDATFGDDSTSDLSTSSPDTTIGQQGTPEATSTVDAIDGRFHKNQLVCRNQNGIWYGNELPVAEWEEPTKRVVLPAKIQLALGLESPVLRWEKESYARHLGQHRELETLDFFGGSLLENWEVAGTEAHPRGSTVILFDIKGDVWLLAANSIRYEFGVRTIFRPRPSYAERQRRTMRIITQN